MNTTKGRARLSINIALAIALVSFAGAVHAADAVLSPAAPSLFGVGLLGIAGLHRRHRRPILVLISTNLDIPRRSVAASSGAVLTRPRQGLKIVTGLA